MQETAKKIRYSNWAAYDYIVWGPSGALRRVTCPAMFDVPELAAKMTHHEIFYRVDSERKHSLPVRVGAEYKTIYQGVAVWSRESNEWHYAGENLPTSDGEAVAMLKTAGVY